MKIDLLQEHRRFNTRGERIVWRNAFGGWHLERTKEFCPVGLDPLIPARSQ